MLHTVEQLITKNYLPLPPKMGFSSADESIYQSKSPKINTSNQYLNISNDNLRLEIKDF
jgi:hypothetical protein